MITERDSMTKQEWLEQASRDKDKLISIIYKYHPVLKAPNPLFVPTAPAAQRACDSICVAIKEATPNRNPVKEFETALTNRDVLAVASILHDTWFGVPETTHCRKLRGFVEAINLLDDMPDDAEDVSAEQDSKAS